MADGAINAFISYSRKDLDFALKLQADLESRGISAWVDVRRLEGGADWIKTIQKAIDSSQVMLVILSPDSVESEWVNREIDYAQRIKLLIIPLMYRKTDLPWQIGRIQTIEFSDYDLGMHDLQIAMNPVHMAAHPTPAVSAPIELSETSPVLTNLVTPNPPPPPPNAELNDLYLSGVRAVTQHELERALILWDQALAQDPGFRNGTLALEADALRPQVRVERIARLRELGRTRNAEQQWLQSATAWKALLEQEPDDPEAKDEYRRALRAVADDLYRTGDWGAEIGVWDLLISLGADENVAKRRIENAQQNQSNAFYYNDARQFSATGEETAARSQLTKLWDRAPHFGDPNNIAEALGMTVPPTLIATSAEEERQAAEEARAREAEQAERDEEGGRQSRISSLRVSASAGERDGAAGTPTARVAAWNKAVDALSQLSTLLPGDADIKSRLAAARTALSEATKAREREQEEERLLARVNVEADNVEKHSKSKAFRAEQLALDALKMAYRALTTLDRAKYPAIESLASYQVRSKPKATQRMYELSWRVAQDQREKQAAADRPRIGASAYFWKYMASTSNNYSHTYVSRFTAFGRVFTVAIAPVLLLMGAGVDGFIVTQSPLIACADVVAVALLAYLVGYSRAVPWWGWLAMTVASAGVIYVVMRYFPIPALDATSKQVAQLPLVGAKTFYLGRQLDVGLILIGVYALVSWGIALLHAWDDSITCGEPGNILDAFDSLFRYQDVDESPRLFLILGFTFLWAIVESIGTAANFGFGFGPGWWDVTLLRGMAPNLAIELGISALVFIAALDDPYKNAAPAATRARTNRVSRFWEVHETSGLFNEFCVTGIIPLFLMVGFGVAALDCASLIPWTASQALRLGSWGMSGQALLALMVALVVSILAYLIVFMKAARWWVWLVVTLLSGGVLFLIAPLFPGTADFVAPQHAQLWLFGSRTVFLGRQLDFGLIMLGVAILAAVALCVYAYNSIAPSEQLEAHLIALLLMLIAVAVWLLVSLLATGLNWEFGYGPGWWTWSLQVLVVPGTLISIGLASTAILAFEEPPVL